jgi:hypothetical protein
MRARAVRSLGILARGLGAGVMTIMLSCRSATVPPRGAPAEVGAGVTDSLRASGSVRVAIALVPPASTSQQGADPQQVRADIARLQAQVLERLDPADYHNRIQYANIPALAGTILTFHGLEVMMADPRVRRIDVDAAGGGLANP